jgi:hypothetical protein
MPSKTVSSFLPLLWILCRFADLRNIIIYKTQIILSFGCVRNGDSCVTPLPHLFLLIQSATQRKAKPIRYSHLKFSFHPGATAPSGPGPAHYRGFTIILSYTSQSVRLLWMNDQPDIETSICTTHNIHISYDGTHLALGGILDRRCHFKHVSLKAGSTTVKRARLTGSRSTAVLPQ